MRNIVILCIKYMSSMVAGSTNRLLLFFLFCLSVLSDLVFHSECGPM